jgi:hypothetical protein
MLLGKLLIFDERIDEGKRMLRIIDLNDMAFTEVLFSIDVSKISGRIEFAIFKCCKTKDHVDGHSSGRIQRRNMT